MDPTDFIIDKFKQYDDLPFVSIGEYEIYKSVEFSAKEKQVPVDNALSAELMAFAFFENNQNDKSYWGTYFGPLISNTNNGKVNYEYPSLALITPDIIDYWEKRACNSQHPTVVARYMGLVWDFSQRVKNAKPNYAVGERYVTSLLDIVNEDLSKEPIYSIIKVKRALSVALSLNKDELVSDVKNTIIALEEKVGEDEKPGLWGFTYDLLYSGKRNLLTDQELNEVVAILENRMANLQISNSWACKAAVNRLADYYHKKGEPEEVKRVLFVLGNSYLSYAEKSSSIQAAGYIEELYHVFSHYRLHTEAKDLLIKLRETQKKTTKDFKKVTASVDIPNEQIEQFVEKVLSGKVEEIFIRILYAHVPSLKDTEEDLLKVAKEHPIKYLMKTGIVDGKGRTIAQVGSIDEDFEGHKALHFSNSIKFNGIGLHFVLRGAIKRNLFTTSSLMEFLSQSCVIADNRLSVIEKGINDFLNKNYVTSIHLLIPQFEEAIRNLIEINGGNIFAYRNGAFQLKTFDHLLSDTIVKDVLGEDMSYYYRILFTDSRGWNLRNNIAHGMIDPESLDEQTNEWIIHALLVLGMIQWQTEIQEA